MHYRYKLNIDGGKDVLTCFLTWNYFESYDAEFKIAKHSLDHQKAFLSLTLDLI